MATHVHIHHRRGPATWLALLGFLAVVFLVAAIGAWATSLGIAEWYPSLVKPGFTPPDWVFGPAWSVLYFLIAVAAWLVWRRAGFSDAGPALALFALQLVLNLAWSIAFFALRQPMLALVVCVLLLMTIAVTMLAFRRVSSVASLLLLPYLLWVGFATALNGGIVALN
jgi:tryptophan-rich sensory protein